MRTLKGARAAQQQLRQRQRASPHQQSGVALGVAVLPLDRPHPQLQPRLQLHGVRLRPTKNPRVGRRAVDTATQFDCLSAADSLNTRARMLALASGPEALRSLGSSANGF